MIYTDQYNHIKQLSPTKEWRSVVGYWIDEDGQAFNFPDAIASKGGTLTFDHPKHKALAKFALNYAKQRREQILNAAQVEIRQLNTVIASME